MDFFPTFMLPEEVTFYEQFLFSTVMELTIALLTQDKTGKIESVWIFY